jgi:hypothetical protein
LLSACASLEPPAPPPAPPPEVYRRADAERLKTVEQENERLRADLKAAEAMLLEVESGLKNPRRRAEAVSMLAEARIEVERAARRTPWRGAAVAEAKEKLLEAERQLAQGHLGSAIFFISRASRIAASLVEEAELIAAAPGSHYIKPRRANLRAEPNTTSDVLAVLPEELPVFVESREEGWALVRTVSGEVGWVHVELLGAR